jgi:hypothetical protein
MPDFRTLGVEVKKPGTTQVGNASFLGALTREGLEGRPAAGSGARARSLPGSVRPPCAGPSSPWGFAE